jgi:hypothetical protein
MDALPILVIVGFLLNLLLFWAIIRNAVRSALRDHQEWLDKRTAPGLTAPPSLPKPPKLS